MVLSAFKSTSKRETFGSSSKSSSSSASKGHALDDSGKNAWIGRSRSVTAVSRSYPKTVAAAPAAGNTSSEFLNKRDNPLFCSSGTSSPESETPAANFKDCDVVSSISRGRSFSRSSMDAPTGNRNQSARILYRVCSGRHLRSSSRERYCSSETGVEKENGESLSSIIKGNGEDCDTFNQRKNVQKWTNRHSFSDTFTAFNAPSLEDWISTSSLSEVEENTIGVHGHCSAGGGVDGIFEAVTSEVQLSVSEIQNDLESAILRNNYMMHSSDNNLETSPLLRNPDTVELVSDIRIEYETMLKESHERARKLRADLAVEEQREQEISRMLKKIIPNECPAAKKSKTRIKSTIKRLDMSRCLAEDAMNYFDECVSISTFDSSDFSSVEDQQPSSVGVNSHVYSSCFLPSEVSEYVAPGTSNGNINNHEELENQNYCNNIEISSSSSSSRIMETDESHDFLNYIKKFEKKSNIEESSRFSFDYYELDNSAESLLQELLILRNRIESGSLLICCNIRTF